VAGEDAVGAFWTSPAGEAERWRMARAGVSRVSIRSKDPASNGRRSQGSKATHGIRRRTTRALTSSASAASSRRPRASRSSSLTRRRASRGRSPGYQPPQGPPGWQQPGYGQPWAGQPQYPVPPQYPQQRKRHTARNLLAGLGGLVVVIIIAVAVANSANHTISTTGTSSNSGTGTGSGTGAGAAKKQTATVGSAITLSGNSGGEQMSVTVTKVISDAQPGDEFSSAPSGDRLYAVQFRLRDTGSAAYSDSPSNGAAVVDSAGQSYQSAFDNAAGCVSFPGS
jgi:hypothetical protein